MCFGQRKVIIHILLIFLVELISEIVSVYNEVQFENGALNISHDLFDFSSDETERRQKHACFIPNIDYTDPTIKKLVDPLKNPPICSNNAHPLLGSNATHIWINRTNLKYFKTPQDKVVSCCYSGLLITTKVSYKDCRYFQKIIAVQDEFVKVTCNIVYEQMFLFAREKPVTTNSLDLFEMQENQTFYNIIIFGLSSVSRLNFRRTMPKTLNFLKEKGAIDMKGYTKVSGDGMSQVISMLVGRGGNDIKKMCRKNPISPKDVEKCSFIWERFKDMGYFTALLEDSTANSIFDLKTTGYNGFQGKPTEYYLYPVVQASQRSRNKDALICTGSNYLFQVVLDYVGQLSSLLQTHKFFGLFWESSISGTSSSDPMLMDDSYKVLLERLYSSGYMNNTIVIMMSDQGLDYEQFSKTKQGKTEERLPFLHFLLPASFRKHFGYAYENLLQNSRRLVTPFDLHETLIDLVTLNSIKSEEILLRSGMIRNHDKRVSMFLKIPNNRTCQSIGIKKSLCSCFEKKQLSRNGFAARGASQFMMQKLNEMLSPYPHCSYLRINSVVEASEVIEPADLTASADTEKVWRDITVVVQATPGDGLFEAALRLHDTGQWTLMSDIGRLNFYQSEQSVCVDDYHLKMYCYCTYDKIKKY